MKRSTFITWEQLRVGGVIIIALVVLTLAVYKLGQAANLFSRRYELVAFLPAANGLRQGGQVTIAGQLAGTVKAIDFLPVDGDTTRNLRVTVEINEHLREQVREDSRAKLQTLGLLGDKVFEITPGTPRYSPLRPGDTLIVARSVDYESLLVQASGAVGDMVDLTHDLRSITGSIVKGEGTVGQILTNRGLYDELVSTLRRTNLLVGRLQSPNGTVGRLLDDPTLYQNLTGMIASVDTLVVQLNSSQGTLGRLIRDDTLYTHLVGIASGADSLVRQFNRGDGFAAKMLSDGQLYDQLLKTVTDLNAILADVRKNPGRYTKGLIKVF
jgi:phospholipid/cholesterol/gamma-HCH transport system substrate-binding protein